jgi:chromosome segregation ATPase
MSIDELQEEVNKLLEERDKLEEKCDTLDLCQEDDGCSRCDIYTKIEEVDAKTAELEEKIESLMPEVEE